MPNFWQSLFITFKQHFTCVAAMDHSLFLSMLKLSKQFARALCYWFVFYCEKREGKKRRTFFRIPNDTEIQDSAFSGVTVAPILEGRRTSTS
jgi:hypothetical protein